MPFVPGGGAPLSPFDPAPGTTGACSEHRNLSTGAPPKGAKLPKACCPSVSWVTPGPRSCSRNVCLGHDQPSSWGEAAGVRAQNSPNRVIEDQGMTE